ncbi:MAG: 50S ribosomal protein L11 methyltransferase [Chthoniobacterales bacterium]
MRAERPSFIWRKRASREWLAANEWAVTEATSGSFAVIENPRQTRLLLEAFCPRLEIAEKLQAQFGGSSKRLRADWEQQALATSAIKPLRIGRRLIVASDPADLRDCDAGTTLIVAAGVGFGTGGHATTAMSLRMLERITRQMSPGWRMFDAGTGSGILALAGCRFEASEVVAVENDPLALATAKANARRNKIRGVKFILGDATTAQAGTFDIITANLYSELLAIALPRWRKNLKDGARIIISGIMGTQEGDILRVLRANRYGVEETRRRGKWIALLCRPVASRR